MGLGREEDLGGQPPGCPGQGEALRSAPWRTMPVHRLLEPSVGPLTHFPNQAGGWGLAGVGSAPEMDA